MDTLPDRPTVGATVNDNSAIYYGGQYWNDLPEVAAWLDAKVSGAAGTYWGAHFARTSGRTFERALVLNCGNGHVERGLLANGVMAEAVGIDWSSELLAEARREAEAAGLPLRYERLDVNAADFPDEPFDLVVNHAAAHHIARIDAVFRELCRRLPADGVFLSHDYVGPHRNQYTWEMWDAARTANRALPERLRNEMYYPCLPRMLDEDPTEAIHSELILPTMRRYFTVGELVPLGGAVAYPVLTHNRALFAADADDPERRAAIEAVLAADDAFTAAHPEATLFAYVVARPDHAVLDDTGTLARWTEEEEAREAAAAANGGQYYPLTTLQEIMLESEDWQETAHRVQRWADEVKGRYDRVMGLPPYAQLRKLAHSRLGQRLRRNPRLAQLLARTP